MGFLPMSCWIAAHGQDAHATGAKRLETLFPMTSDKSALRSKIRGIAETRSNASALSLQLSAQLRGWTLWQASASIAAFAATAGEPETLDPWPQDKRVALPRISKEILAFHWIANLAELKAGKFGILEPDAGALCAGNEFDLILVPGLAFDLGGGRLGRGRGFYDRFLANAHGIRVGICFDDQIVARAPMEAHDLRMDFVVTPSAIYRCGS